MKAEESLNCGMDSEGQRQGQLCHWQRAGMEETITEFLPGSQEWVTESWVKILLIGGRCVFSGENDEFHSKLARTR